MATVILCDGCEGPLSLSGNTLFSAKTVRLATLENGDEYPQSIHMFYDLCPKCWDRVRGSIPEKLEKQKEPAK